MNRFFTLLAAILLTATTFAQIGINNENPDASAALDITSTTGGLLVPRMTETQRDAISPAATGLMIYQTDGTAGFYYYNGSSWKGYYSKNEVDALIANLQPTSSWTYNIGDIVNGGVVFWIDSTGQHGLVAAMSDYATFEEWGCDSTDLPNVPNVTSFPPVGQGAEIGHGFNNTNAILYDCPNAPAALAARSLGPDWFLPSINELNQMYINKDDLEAVSGFTAFSNYYWSSTDYDNNIAWFQFFYDGYQYITNKDNPTIVRAVRAF
jgi:hypothetical protein